MIKPIGLIDGHYECRSMKQTVPILADLLALKVVDEKNGEMTLKHPKATGSPPLCARSFDFQCYPRCDPMYR
jgi:hypothetical protein